MQHTSARAIHLLPGHQRCVFQDTKSPSSTPPSGQEPKTTTPLGRPPPPRAPVPPRLVLGYHTSLTGIGKGEPGGTIPLPPRARTSHYGAMKTSEAPHVYSNVPAESMHKVHGISSQPPQQTSIQ